MDMRSQEINLLSDNELSCEELDCVSGGINSVSGGIKGGLEGLCRKDGGTSGQNDPAQMFQQILQQLTQ
jgi:hypothetical protein